MSGIRRRSVRCSCLEGSSARGCYGCGCCVVSVLWILWWAVSFGELCFSRNVLGLVFYVVRVIDFKFYTGGWGLEAL